MYIFMVSFSLHILCIQKGRCFFFLFDYKYDCSLVRPHIYIHIQYVYKHSSEINLKGYCRCERWGYIGFFWGAESENVTDF